MVHVAPSALPVVDLGVIGGSGLYDLDALEQRRELELPTPFGPPSDKVILGRLHGVRVAFVPRHGRGHTLLPSEVNYRANVWLLKRLGARFVLSVSAVGSLREDIAPGHLVCPDQLIDRTHKRASTFFGDGVVAHVPFGDPLDSALRALLVSAARRVASVPVHDGGAYVCIEGPTFSTRAESNLLRAAGASVVGMTNLPEARLAREAELAYATLALSTDYDCWHAEHEAVTVEAVLAVMRQNISQARAVVEAFCADLAPRLDDPFPAHAALAGGAAIMTRRDLIPAETRARLEPLIGRYLNP
ncbi:MAG: S-methyl-5'-thioadenosine phosphorylase [Deltaproteobacteria bacterium]|nr:S-methyl-5'-thioadenosine phosphorylase [Deltaproteobacteria bacterium]